MTSGQDPDARPDDAQDEPAMADSRSERDWMADMLETDHLSSHQTDERISIDGCAGDSLLCLDGTTELKLAEAYICGRTDPDLASLIDQHCPRLRTKP